MPTVRLPRRPDHHDSDWLRLPATYLTPPQESSARASKRQFLATSTFQWCPSNNEYEFEPRSNSGELAGLIGGLALRAAAGLGGWDFAVHHSYDPVAHVLYRGDGSQESNQSGAAQNIANFRRARGLV